jgi:hypothetical protein
LFQVVTDETKVVAKDHYLALPLEIIGENRFRATLVIQVPVLQNLFILVIGAQA